jgi:hypothetical protein
MKEANLFGNRKGLLIFINDKMLFYLMNGEYEMCACGHFRKDHAHGIGVTVSNCGCGCMEFRKRS